jgi:hypothetical protein
MRFPKFLIAASVAVCLAGPTLAQPPEGGRRMMGGGPGMQASAGGLLRNKSVQDELKITEEQKEKLQKALREVAENVGNMRDMDEEERRDAMRKMGEETNKVVKEVLNEEQQNRLMEIRWQQAPATGFASPEFHEALKFSEDQKEKLKGIMEEMGKDMREIMQEGRENPRESREKMEALRKETKEKVMGVLTAEQKASLEKLSGKPFELKMEMRRPGGDGDGKEKPKRPKGKEKPKSDD